MIQRTSPIHDQLQGCHPVWQEVNGMPAVLNLPDDPAKSAHLGLADLSFLTRFGVKGAKAATWLQTQGLAVPETANTWCPLPEGGVVARLGLSEFLVEDSLQTAIASQLTQTSLSPGVYPVLRQDLAIALSGTAVPDLLLQTCSVNFRALALEHRPVVLTSMIGVAVVVMPGERSGQPFYRIWCDGSFGSYVWRTLLEIAEELGGGLVGAACMMADHRP